METFGRIIPYHKKKVCSKECSSLRTKILISTLTYQRVYASTLDLSKVSFLYSKEPLWNKIVIQKSAQIGRAKTYIKFS